MRRVVLVFTLIGALGCEAQRAVPPPPAGSYTVKTVQVKIGQTVVTARAAEVTPEFFPAVKIQPLLGRFFLDNEYPPADGTLSRLIAAVAVLSHAFWTEKFAASPSVIGSKIDIDGHPTVIVGILPGTFTAPDGTQLWKPKW